MRLSGLCCHWSESSPDESRVNSLFSPYHSTPTTINTLGLNLRQRLSLRSHEIDGYLTHGETAVETTKDLNDSQSILPQGSIWLKAPTTVW